MGEFSELWQRWLALVAPFLTDPQSRDWVAAAVGASVTGVFTAVVAVVRGRSQRRAERRVARRHLATILGEVRSVFTAACEQLDIVLLKWPSEKYNYVHHVANYANSIRDYKFPEAIGEIIERAGLSETDTEYLLEFVEIVRRWVHTFQVGKDFFSGLPIEMKKEVEGGLTGWWRENFEMNVELIQKENLPALRQQKAILQNIVDAATEAQATLKGLDR